MRAVPCWAHFLIPLSIGLRSCDTNNYHFRELPELNEVMFVNCTVSFLANAWKLTISRNDYDVYFGCGASPGMGFSFHPIGNETSLAGSHRPVTVTHALETGHRFPLRETKLVLRFEFL